MADRYLLESGAPDGYQLEDGSGVLSLEGVTTAPVAGTLRHSSRLRSLGIILGYSSAPLRAVALLLGATLLSDVAVASTLRAPQARLTGALTVRMPVSGTVRHTDRLIGQLQSTVALQGSIQATERLIGQVQVAGTAALAGTLQHTTRLTGSLTVPSETLELTSRLRATPARLRATAFQLVYHSAPIHAHPRLTGNLSVVFGTPPLQGSIRHSSVVAPAELTTTFSAAEIVGTTARLTGQLRLLAVERGTLRYAGARLTGLVSVGGAGITSRLRVTQAVLRGDLTVITPVAMQGTLRGAHARLIGQVQLLTEESLQGTIRASTARLTAQVVQDLALQSVIRAAHLRIQGAGLSIFTPGSTVLQGVVHAHARLISRVEVVTRAVVVLESGDQRYLVVEDGEWCYGITESGDVRYEADP